MLEFHLERVKYLDQTEYLYMLIQDIVINSLIHNLRGTLNEIRKNF